MSEVSAKSQHSAGSVPLSFVANVSHELRGPLHAIMGLSELLAERDIRQEDKRLVKALRTEAGSLKVLIEDLLDYARMSDAGLELTPSVFSPVELVASLVESARPAAVSKGLTLEFRAAPEVSSHVTGDFTRYGQVVRNLVGNAVKFSQSGSVLVELSTDSQSLVCEVADTGPGIDPAKVDQIFMPFEQLHGTGKGAGLGLAICSEIATLMDGSIEVSSQVGIGSTFSFSAMLPAATAPPKPASVQADKAKTGSVLVVEDNEVNQLLATQQLKLIGYTAVVVGDGESCLEEVSEDHIAVLMDWNLPGIDGLETTRRIRAMGGYFSKLPIIAMTANALGSDADACFAAGMNGFLSKPVAVADLKAELNRVVDSDNDERDETCSLDDLSVLQRLERELGSSDIVKQLVETFLGELSTHVTQIKQMEDESGFALAQRSAHTLSSTAGLLGSHRLSELCREFSRHKSWEDSHLEAVTDIATAAADSELVLREYLDK